MNYLPKNKEAPIMGTPTGGAIDQFYAILYELEMDMIQCKRNKDFYGMIDTFEEIYNKVFPYIEKYLTKEDKEELEELSDIQKLINQLKKGDSDHIDNINRNIGYQIIRLLNYKRRKISKLQAKAGLYIPLQKARLTGKF